MATTRETKHRRSRSDLPQGYRGPQERSQVFAHATPNDLGQRSNEDLRILNAAFGDFFQRLQSATMTMMESAAKDRLHEVQIERERRSVQGAADAHAGFEPAFPEDLNYMKAFARTKGINVGTKAATDFIAELSKQPVGTDPEAFRDEFFKQQLGGGTGDAYHDAAMYATFKNKTDEAVLAFRVNNAKDLRMKGVAALSEEVFAKATEATIDDLRDWVARSTELNLGDAVKGRAQVLNALISAANTPRSLQKVNSLLHVKGYMEDGRSFADAFPLSAQELSEKATASYLSSLSAEAFEQYSNIEAKMRDPDIMGDEVAVLNLIKDVGAVRDRFGGERLHDALVGKLQAHLDKIVQEKAALNAFILKGVQGGYPVDQEEINKYLPKVLERHLALKFGQPTHPLASPQAAEEAAFVVQHYHGIDDDLKATMSAAVQDVKAPQAQANAVRFYRRLAAEGKDVSQFMSADAYKAYVAIEALNRTTARGSLEDALKLYNANPNAQKDIDAKGKGIDWPVLMGRPGDTRERVVTDVLGELREGVAEKLGITRFFGLFDAPGRIVMQPDVQNELLADYARTVIAYQAHGVPDAHDTARKAVVEGLAQNYLTIPGVDGAVQIVRKRDFPAFNNTANIGPGMFFNPHTGEMENTLEVFRRDIENVRNVLPGIFGSPENFFVSRGKGHVTPDGSFLLMDGETFQPVTFAPGQEIALNEPDSVFLKNLKGLVGMRSEDGKRITLSTDVNEAQKELESILPKHFRIEADPSDLYGPVLRVYYKFHVSEPEDIASLAARYKRPPRIAPTEFNRTPGGAATGRALQRK